jgi:MoaA/NifB/PqqE/SkfB family radical SAM enzyme
MVIKKLISNKSYKLFGFPKNFPMNLTLGLSYNCNSRCKTCNIWKIRNFENEFKLVEFEKVFKKIGKGKLYLLILTGGEPFLHKNLVEIAALGEKYCEPSSIVIPTNCILGLNIVPKVKEILNQCKKSHITINISVDGIGEKHDEIRGIPGNFKRAMDVYKELKLMEKQHKNFDVSLHTVISKFNYKEFENIYNELIKLKPHNYITEIAEKRVELNTIGSDITPNYEEYSKAIDVLINEISKQKNLSLKQSLRLEYYKTVKKIIKEKRQIVPCYAGIASAQIDPTGEVWFCCVRAESIGNLRDVDYDLMRLWYNDKAKKQRKSIANKECYCPLASANYTNLSLDPISATKVISNMARSRLRR